MVADILLHTALDMSGAVTFACIVGRCKNPRHQHGRLYRFVANHPWTVQLISAVALAYITVRIVG